MWRLLFLVYFYDLDHQIDKNNKYKTKLVEF